MKGIHPMKTFIKSEFWNLTAPTGSVSVRFLTSRSLNMAYLGIESKLAFLKELFQDFRRFNDKRHAMNFFEMVP